MTYIEFWDATQENCLGSCVAPDADVERTISYFERHSVLPVGDIITRTATQEDVDNFVSMGGYLLQDATK